MTNLSELLRAATLRTHPVAHTSDCNWQSTCEEAARWLDVLQDAGSRERAQFSSWVIQSPQHVEAFLLITEIDRELRKMGTDRNSTSLARSNAATSRSTWSELKTHPLVITTGAAILAASIAWAVATAVLVEPRNQKIEQLQSALAAAQKLPVAAPGNH